MPRNFWWWVDRRTNIVVRSQKAVRLGYVQFAIFDALHRQGHKRGYQLKTRLLMDEVYRGVTEPARTIHVHIAHMNTKLRHLDLRVRGVNRSQNSFYQIVTL